MRKILRRPLRPGAVPAPAADEGAQDAPQDAFEAEPPPPDPSPAGDWTEADLVLPRSKRLISLRIDAEVLDYFQRGGKGYQTRMNAVLRAFMEARKRRGD